ncbi:hypothetical protein [Actinophytocola sp.]|uniref:hypothetical protein n=1 Tax=Actinophytocola sp. TaxID=1872138 RepID=UPI002EDB5185
MITAKPVVAEPVAAASAAAVERLAVSAAVEIRPIVVAVRRAGVQSVALVMGGRVEPAVVAAGPGGSVVRVVRLVRFLLVPGVPVRAGHPGDRFGLAVVHPGSVSGERIRICEVGVEEASTAGARRTSRSRPPSATLDRFRRIFDVGVDTLKSQGHSRRTWRQS